MHKKRVLTSVAGHNGVCRAHFIQFAQCIGNESVGRTVRSALCAVPHMSRSTASRVPVRLRSDSVTSRIFIAVRYSIGFLFLLDRSGVRTETGVAGRQTPQARQRSCRSISPGAPETEGSLYGALLFLRCFG